MQTHQKIPAYSPKSHQIDAANAVIAEFATADRATIVLPCGSGKTMIAEIVAKKMSPETAILFFPSIALIKQTLAAWKRDKPIGDFDYLCVCSDETVARDDSSAHVSDLVDEGDVVTTDGKHILSFMEAHTGRPKVLFSTYQSSMAIRLPWQVDLAIMDEAHRTAGKEGLFSHPLDDANLDIRKRLFMTATPRHAQADNSDTKSFSMLDEDRYGRICYIMSISEAIQQGLICDYRIVVSVVTDESIGKIEEENPGEDHKLLALAAAIESAIVEFGVSKIISFHGSVASAKNFASSAPVRNIIASLNSIHHVNGTMKLAERDETLSSFAATASSLVTNARCLTEGVDIPAVDMVVIASRRTAVTDIVQSSGRALRIHAGKEIGYIAIPIMLNIAKGETIEHAIKRSGFGEVWRVVNSMREQDMILADGSSYQSRLRDRSSLSTLDKIEVVGSPGSEMLSTIRNGIRTVLAERINTRSWNETFEILVEQHKRLGTWKFGKVDPEYGFLDDWLQTQRKSMQSGKISAEKKKAIEEIGLNYMARVGSDRWSESLDAFVMEFKKTGKHPKSRWVASQRQFWKAGHLSKEREAKLVQAGFILDPLNLGKKGSRKKKIEDGHFSAIAPGYDGPQTNGRGEKEDFRDFRMQLWMTSVNNELTRTAGLSGVKRYESFITNLKAMHGLQRLLEEEETGCIDHAQGKEDLWFKSIKPMVKEVFSYRKEYDGKQ